MRDHRRGQHVHALRARIVAHQDAGELAFLDDGRGKAAFLVLERQAQAVDEERRALQLVAGDLNGRDGAGRGDERVVALQLEDVDAVANDGVLDEFERRDAGEEVLGVWFEQGEVGLVVDVRHARVGLLAALGAFEFDVVVVGHELRGDEHAVTGDDRAEAVEHARVLLRPGPEEIVILVGRVHAHDGRVGLGDGTRRGGCRQTGHGRQERRQTQQLGKTGHTGKRQSSVQRVTASGAGVSRRTTVAALSAGGVAGVSSRLDSEMTL